jgi:crotonobetainyl-CoA:carnitine CoA-transferase CaiB-like acyl-CoA transferase
MRRLGLGYEELAKHNPALVYCAISGFGQDGPLEDAPAYDQIIQGLSGVMSITGDNRSAPMRVGYPVADTIGGINAAFAISAALVRRASTGQGAFIDVSLLDCMIASMGWVVSNYLIADVKPTPMGNDNFTAAPSGTFATGSGLINIAANKQEQFEALVRALEREDLIRDERFSGRETRKRNRTALTVEIEQALRCRSAAEWEPIFNELGIPAGRVLSVPEALNVAQVKHRQLFQTLDDVPERNRSITVTRAGFKIAGADPQVRSRPPQLGEHTEEILKGIGYDDSEIEHLRDVGAV